MICEDMRGSEFGACSAVDLRPGCFCLALPFASFLPLDWAFGLREDGASGWALASACGSVFAAASGLGTASAFCRPVCLDMHREGGGLFRSLS